VGDLGARAHHDDDALRLRVAGVLNEAVGAAADLGESSHRGLDVGRALRVEAVAGFARLEERIRILGRAAQQRPVGGQRPLAMRRHEFNRQQREQFVVRDQSDLGDFVRRPESIEEVQERDAGAQRGELPDGREIMGLLDRARRQHGEPRLAARHHVGMIAENRQRVGGDRAGRDVHAERGQLARDLEHVRDHQEQPL